MLGSGMLLLMIVDYVRTVRNSFLSVAELIQTYRSRTSSLRRSSIWYKSRNGTVGALANTLKSSSISGSFASATLVSLIDVLRLFSWPRYTWWWLW